MKQLLRGCCISSVAGSSFAYQRGPGHEATVERIPRHRIDPFRRAPYSIPRVQPRTEHHCVTLGYSSMCAMVGHNFGSLVAGLRPCEPWFVERVVLMSAEFSGARSYTARGRYCSRYSASQTSSQPGTRRIGQLASRTNTTSRRREKGTQMMRSTMKSR